MDHLLKPMLEPRGEKMMARRYTIEQLDAVLLTGQLKAASTYPRNKPVVPHLDTLPTAAHRARWRMHITNLRNYENRLTTDEWLYLTQQPCFYCGEPPTPTRVGGCSDVILYNGIDRVDNTVGYTLGNCVSSCYCCNRMKGVLTLNEFVKHINKLHSHLQNI